jgi:hypothetical protein
VIGCGAHNINYTIEGVAFNLTLYNTEILKPPSMYILEDAEAEISEQRLSYLASIGLLTLSNSSCGFLRCRDSSGVVKNSVIDHLTLQGDTELSVIDSKLGEIDAMYFHGALPFADVDQNGVISLESSHFTLRRGSTSGMPHSSTSPQ